MIAFLLVLMILLIFKFGKIINRKLKIEIVPFRF